MFLYGNKPSVLFKIFIFLLQTLRSSQNNDTSAVGAGLGSSQGTQVSEMLPDGKNRGGGHI